MPVFLTALSTILGAILFLRFGWAVGNVGLLGTILIIIVGHLVAVPTALAVAEIATHLKVQGGGAYYIISRSFGLNIGGAIGIALYLSQAISISFYVIAFAEAFEPVLNWLAKETGWLIYDKRAISLPIMGILAVIMLTRGANLGMKALYGISAILGASLLMFFLGSPTEQANPEANLYFKNEGRFFDIFIIIFPAFTGLAAGLGLSGDLRNPQKSIPRGTLWATVVGLVVYIAAAYKLSISAGNAELADPKNQLIMQDIAIWGPIIPIGLAAASLSSALGSIIVAPRTLQAIGVDDIFPNRFFNKWLAKGKEGTNEPINGSVISIIIAFFFIAVSKNGINFVAEIISMFFMITYGVICLISFLEHFAADPSYRPTFRSKWYFSMVGAILSFWLMFQMDLPYAALSVIIMAMLYYFLTIQHKGRKGLEKLFKGVVFQLSRQLQVFAQRASEEEQEVSWRPFVICISKDSFIRRSAFDMLRWISYKYGFGTYIHYIKGFLNEETNAASKKALNSLIHLSSGSKSRVYLDTIISPSYTSAIAQVIQLSGISGKGNNMILFEFSRTDPQILEEALKNYPLIKTSEFDICILNTSYKGFGYKQEIHIWITTQDYENANLMILMAYIILGHPEWRKGVIKIFAIYPQQEINIQKEHLLNLIKNGRLPISHKNVEFIASHEQVTNAEIISKKSIDADLTIVGFLPGDIEKNDIKVFNSYPDIGNVLFVCSNKQKPIK